MTALQAAPRPGATEGREHRDRLLQGMARAVATKGYADTTIADIVREAGVSRRTFYENFADKAECLTALYESASGNALAVLRGAINPQSDWQARWSRRCRRTLVRWPAIRFCCALCSLKS